MLCLLAPNVAGKEPVPAATETPRTIPANQPTRRMLQSMRYRILEGAVRVLSALRSHMARSLKEQAPEMATTRHHYTGVTLGDEYTDEVHGIKGRATAVYEFLHGCARVQIEYVDGDGNITDHVFDIGQLVHVDTGKKLRARTAPPSHADGAVAG